MDVKFKRLPISVKVSRLIAVIVVSTILATSSLFLNIGAAEATHGGIHIVGGTENNPDGSWACPPPIPGGPPGPSGSGQIAMSVEQQDNGQFLGFVDAAPIIQAGRITSAETDGETFTIHGFSSLSSCGMVGATLTYTISGDCGTGVTVSASVSNGARGTYPANVRCEAAAAANSPPTANAGPDQTVNEGKPVTLDGSASSDTDGTIASYSWTQTAGTSVTLTGANTASPTFTAPDVGPEGETLTFSLTVTDDDGATSTTSDTVDITVNDVVVNSPPTAALTANPRTINEGETSALDASGSSDPDSGDSLTYSFTILDGPGTITDHTGASDPTATYEAPSDVSSDQTVTIQVEVNDGNGGTDTATVEILVTDNPPPPLTEQFRNEGQCIKAARQNPDLGITRQDCQEAFADVEEEAQLAATTPEEEDQSLAAEGEEEEGEEEEGEEEEQQPSADNTEDDEQP